MINQARLIRYYTQYKSPTVSKWSDLLGIVYCIVIYIVLYML